MDAAERETSITWTDADHGTAEIYTSQRPMVTRLRKIRGAERVEVHRTAAGAWTGETWRVPVGYVQIRAPKRVSEAQRERMRIQGRARGFGTHRTASTAVPDRQSAPSGAGRDGTVERLRLADVPG